MSVYESMKKFLKGNPVTSPLWSVASYIRHKPRLFINECAIKRSRDTIKQYRNRYEGQRCFIIGNGPSLRASDLDRIKDEISFASNRIYVIFNETEWRPTFYTFQDYVLIMKSLQEIQAVQAKELKIIPRFELCKYPRTDGFKSIWIKLSPKLLEDHDLPDFSSDITDCVYEGLTITYTNIQIAAYMGFKEIILLGVDHHYSAQVHIDGTITTDDTAKNYFSPEYLGNETLSAGGTLNMARLEESTLSYMAARQYAEQHGIRILNATRGGKLEVFERVNFDDIVSG